jgi:hypothetical protein
MVHAFVASLSGKMEHDEIERLSCHRELLVYLFMQRVLVLTRDVHYLVIPTVRVWAALGTVINQSRRYRRPCLRRARPTFPALLV